MFQSAVESNMDDISEDDMCDSQFNDIGENYLTESQFRELTMEWCERDTQLNDIGEEETVSVKVMKQIGKKIR